jgi:hypothetical protein
MLLLTMSIVDLKKSLKLIMDSVRFNSRQTTMLVSTAILVPVCLCPVDIDKHRHCPHPAHMANMQNGE